MKKYALIVAAGESRRMGGDMPKPYRMLAGKPVLHYSLQAFRQAFEEVEPVLVIQPEFRDQVEEILQQFPGWSPRIVAGGQTRFQSVRKGMESIEGEGVVWVHDAARPLIRPELIRELYEDCLEYGSAIPVLDVVDSFREQEPTGRSRSLDRSRLRLVQTPQTFRCSLLREAMKQGERPEFTDEATVVESLGHEVHLSRGQIGNIKITWPLDMVIAEALIRNDFQP